MAMPLSRFAAAMSCAAILAAVPALAGDGEVLNDVHSRLNATMVREVVRPTSIDELRNAIERARREGLSVSIAGGRHAMGGQQFARDALHLDMSGFARVLRLDRERGIVSVESGIGWPALVRELEALQAGDSRPWGIVQKQTGADELSIGGAMSANAHGRGLIWKPFIQEVEGFQLMLADGREIEVSRTQNPELFSVVIGGYGLFGVITTVELRLQRSLKLRRDVVELPLTDFPDAIAKRIAQGALYGDLQFKTNEKAPDFMKVGVFSTYTPVAPETPVTPNARKLSDEQWRKIFALAHVDKERAYDIYRDHYLATTGQIYSSDTHQLSYYDPDYETELHRIAPDYPAGSLMITELYVPMGSLTKFMDMAATDFRQDGTNLVYGTIRLIRRDDESYLAWAREDFACVVMNLRVNSADADVVRAQEAFRKLIDRALALGGSYYLTYHRWARKDQVLAAYPQFVAFLKLKRKYDPEERFQSEWYRHYRTMFADELAAS